MHIACIPSVKVGVDVLVAVTTNFTVVAVTTSVATIVTASGPVAVMARR